MRLGYWTIGTTLALLAFHGVAQAASLQDLEALRTKAAQFAQSEVAGLPGTKEITVGSVDPRTRLPACAQLDAFLPPGNRLWGNTMIGLQCRGPSPWTLYVPVTVKIFGAVVVPMRPLAQGSIVSGADLSTQTADLTQLPSGVILSPEHAVGKTLTASVPAGFPLRADMLKTPLIVQYGQNVKVLTRGRGFQVSAEGKALGNAGQGQIVSVRMPSGQVVSGVVKAEGIVEIAQ